MQRLSLSLRHAHLIYGGPRRYFHVVIHDTAVDMHRAAEAYNGQPLGDDCLGCCQPAPVRERYSTESGKWEQYDPAHFAGIVRFVREHVTTEIVAHELTHAALAVYRMDINPNVRLGNGCRLREEHLAYIAGDLIGAASTVLHDAGIWG